MSRKMFDNSLVMIRKSNLALKLNKAAIYCSVYFGIK